MDKIQAIRGKLVNHEGALNDTMLCDKGIVMNIVGNDGGRCQVDGEWYKEKDVQPKKLFVEITFSAKPIFREDLAGTKDARDLMERWSRSFISIGVDFHLALYFMNSIHWKEVEVAQSDWIDLSAFADGCEMVGNFGLLKLNDSEQLSISEFRAVISEIESFASYFDRGFDGCYNSIPREKRAEVLAKLKEVSAILKTA